ncbi:MAG TPA: hypothetical protein VGD16_04705 [Enterovirga sp.]|jgi:hypothetical protein
MRFARPMMLAFVVGLPAVAQADDRTECKAGIEMIRAEIAAKPAQPILNKLQAALRVAEREQKEQEFDECMDAIKDARKALGR